MTDDHGQPTSHKHGLSDIGAARRVLGAILENKETQHNENLPAIPGYIVESELGRGGSGVVYAALKEGSEHRVALKLLHQRLGDGPRSARAWRELEVTSQIRSPALPRVLDYAVHDGCLFIVTELIEGERLDQYCDSHQQNQRARVELLAKVADALHTLHEAGVIHRDIKPSNILVDPSGQPMLIDLGIAALLARDAMETLTADGVPIGSPAFMSPEQARGDSHAISTRSDVYNLGATAYLLLTGETPHDVNTTLHTAVQRVANDPPRQIREINNSIDRALAAVLERAAALRPADRYDSASAFAADLRRWLNREPVEARPAGPWIKATRWVGKHPIATTSIIWVMIVVCSLGTLGGGLWWMRNQPSHFENDPDHAELRLISASGNIIKSWDHAAGKTRLLFGDIVKRPIEFGGGRVALTVTDSGLPGDLSAGSLCVRTLDDLDHFIWKTPINAPGIEAPDVPEWRDWKSSDDSFNVGSVELLDIFKDSPGMEILIQFTHHAYHPTCLRIYNIEGNILWEWWHAGALASLMWHDELGQIAFCGLYGHRDIEQYGVSLPLGYSGHKWPRIVGAITPRINEIIRPDWVNPSKNDLAAHADWYRALFPFERAWQYKFTTAQIPNHLAGRSEGIEVRVSAIKGYLNGGEVTWLLDIWGGVQAIESISDPFKSAHPDDPENYLKLGELEEWRREQSP